MKKAFGLFPIMIGLGFGVVGSLPSAAEPAGGAAVGLVQPSPSLSAAGCLSPLPNLVLWLPFDEPSESAARKLCRAQ